jgi:hypothetical protein
MLGPFLNHSAPTGGRRKNMATRFRKVRNAAGRMGWARLTPFTFAVNLTSSALADGNSIAGSFTTDPGLPFILTEMRCENDSDTATLTTAQQMLFSITDGANQMLYSNIPIPRSAMFGTRDFPRQLPSEVEVAPSDTITVTMTNKTGAALSTVTRVCFSGYKLTNWGEVKPEE